MNSPTSTAQAKSIFHEPKSKLCERVTAHLNSIGGIANSLGRGASGKAQESVRQAIDSFVATENHISASEENLKKLQLLHIHMNYQFENIEKNVQQLENLKEQAQSMRR